MLNFNAIVLKVIAIVFLIIELIAVNLKVNCFLIMLYNLIKNR